MTKPCVSMGKNLHRVLLYPFCLSGGGTSFIRVWETAKITAGLEEMFSGLIKVLTNKSIFFPFAFAIMNEQFHGSLYPKKKHLSSFSTVYNGLPTLILIGSIQYITWGYFIY